MEKYIKAPLEKEIVKTLRAGEYVYITGTIYTARDAAHKRMDETLREGKELPVPLKDEIVYYMGPSPALSVQQLLQVPLWLSSEFNWNRNF